MTVAQEVKKFTWLLDNVEVKGKVLAWGENGRLPEGTEVGTGDSFDIAPDENYRHLVSYVPGYGPWIQCETYPLDDPAKGEINRREPWFLPKKSETVPFVVRDPATGGQVALKVGDHVRVVGRWVIDHHPESCVTRVRGALKVGCAHIEFHPFRWDDIRLVKALNAWEFEEEIVSVAAPLHTETYLGGGKHLANEVAGVASKIFIAEDGSNYHNTVTARAYIKAPRLPVGFIPHRALIGFQEEVRVNGTGHDIAKVRTLEVVDDGIKVTATVDAPRTLQFDNLWVGDVNDPANLRSIFQIRYRVWWQPRLVFINEQGGSLTRIEFAPQDTGSARRFEVFVKNWGPDPLQVTGVSLIDDPNHVFQLDPVTTGVLPTGVALDLQITFAPRTFGTFSGTLVVQSNDPAHASISIRISGVAWAKDTRPAVGANADGRLELLYTGIDNVLYHNWQTVLGGRWSGEQLLGAATHQGKVLAVVQNADGRLELLYTGIDNVLYHDWQTAPGGSWSGENLLGTSSNQARTLAVAQNTDGRLEVFYIGTNNVLYHNWQTVPGGSWSGEQLLGASTNQGKALAVAQNADGHLELFYIGTDDVLYHNWQTVPGGSWSGEQLLGASTNQGKALAVAQNADGRLELFYIGTDDVLYHNWQTAPGGSWSGEQLLGASTNQGKALAVAENADGRLELFYIGTDDVLYHNWQTVPGGSWSGEQLLGASTNQGKALAVAQNADGRLELFYIGTDDVLYHNWQTAPGGSWSGEQLLSERGFQRLSLPDRSKRTEKLSATGSQHSNL